MELVSTGLILVVLVALGGLVALPAVPLLRRARGGWGQVGRTIALCGVAFFLTWCVVPIFVFPSDEVAVGMTMFAFYGAMIEALTIAVAACVAAYGDRLA